MLPECLSHCTGSLYNKHLSSFRQLQLRGKEERPGFPVIVLIACGPPYISVVKSTQQFSSAAVFVASTLCTLSFYNARIPVSILLSRLQFTMSWFSSWWSKTPLTPSQLAPQEPRLLDEPQSKPEQTSRIEPAPEEKQLTRQHVANINQSNRGKVIFGAGLLFFGFSLLITRRAFARKRFSNPAFYANAPEVQAEQAKKVSGAMEALEALNIATVNVLSMTMLATGAGMWALNINSIADARRVLRGGLGVDGSGRSEKDAEEDFEEWMATVLARKETKGPQTPQTNERGQQR